MPASRIAAVLFFASLQLSPSVLGAQGSGPSGPIDPVVPSDSAARADSTAKADFLAKLNRRSGEITLDGGMAVLRLPASVSFIDHAGAKLLLEVGWGNPVGAADDVLGMIIPADGDPLEDGSWGIVIEFNDDGYVSDKDAAKIDFTALLKQMQESTEESNEAREKAGYGSVRLLGWAEPPSYDAGSHKMYWAKELDFGGDGNHTLNYAVRILGRRGVLELNAVAGMDQLTTIRDEVRQLLPAVEFAEGHRYTDYVEGTDKLATYGLMGLVAGAMATKAGLFKVLLAGLLAAKKFLVIGVVALGAAAKKFFGKKSAA